MIFSVGNYFHSFKLCSSRVVQIAMGRNFTEIRKISGGRGKQITMAMEAVTEGVRAGFHYAGTPILY